MIQYDPIEDTKEYEEAMKEICSRWSLPENYIEFLNKHKDNLYVNTNDEEEEDFSYENEIEIYGAKGLIIGQHGYSYNPVENAVVEDWNLHYIVIANENADPYCIDITMDNSPVYHAVHGAGSWEFSTEFESLEDFWGLLGIY